APTEVPREPRANLGLGRRWVLVEQLARGHQEPRRAESALQPVRVVERFLQGVQRAVRGRQALDGRDLLAGRLHGEEQARTNRAAGEKHRAGAADAVLAAHVRPGEPELVAQDVGERDPWLDRSGSPHAVDRERDVHQATAAWARSRASVTARRATAIATRRRY